tara:strand:+ start:43027 stop:43344 length:318 start_codon:yes stop_codon:yes gene_type:complete
MSPQVKATLQAFSEHFSDFEDDDDFVGEENTNMCFEIDVYAEDGGVTGRTMVYSGYDKNGNPMVRDYGEFEILANGEIITWDGLSKFITNNISEKGLEIHERGNS